MHDWTRVDAGLFHAFHQHWIVKLSDGLNAGGLPSDYYALIELSNPGPFPGELALRLCSEEIFYARRADRVAVKHRDGRILAVIELISPGDKGSSKEIQSYVEKISTLIRQGVQVLLVDLFPPTESEPQGIHKAIWDELGYQLHSPPPDEPLIIIYSAGSIYVEPFSIGEDLPAMLLFLEPGLCPRLPLEEIYRTSWADFPAALKGLLEGTDADGDRPPDP